jgi:hypothetical protein
MIEAGKYATVREIAEAEGVNASYASRVLRLTLLAPEIIDTMVRGVESGPGPSVKALLHPIPALWRDQISG